MSDVCPCGTERTLAQCCGRFLDGKAYPETAEQLMRSRYAAYVTRNVDYVIASHEPKARGEIDRDSTKRWSEEASWRGLELVSTQNGGATDDRGQVEFIARYALQDREVAHHELATFERIDGRWYYVDGEMIKAKPVVREAAKIGRNDPCACGSGLKYKKCHGK